MGRAHPWGVSDTPLVADLRLAALGQCTAGCGLLLQSGWGDWAEEQGCKDCGEWKGRVRVGGSILGSRSRQCVAQGQTQNHPRGPQHGLLHQCSLWGPLISFALVRPHSPTREHQSGMWLCQVSLPELTQPLPRRWLGAWGPESAHCLFLLPPDSLTVHCSGFSICSFLGCVFLFCHSAWNLVTPNPLWNKEGHKFITSEKPVCCPFFCFMPTVIFIPLLKGSCQLSLLLS